MRVLVFANDVVPGFGLPVAAPGLRAWGLAEGLRRHGHDVVIGLDRGAVRDALVRPEQGAGTSGVRVAMFDDARDLLQAMRPDALVLTNSVFFGLLEHDLGRTTYIFDFFAPELLELRHDPTATALTRRRVRRRKLAALARADAVIINGSKKSDYVAGWLRRAGREPASVPMGVVPMPLDISMPTAATSGPIHALVSGYISPWSAPTEWTEAVRPLLEDGRLVLHLLVANHWGSGRDADEMPEAYRRLVESPNVVRHGLASYDEFRRIVGQCHLSIDVFPRSPERELAMVTRSLVPLASGVPVIHVPFTEVGPLIERHHAGWTVGDESDAVAKVLTCVLTDRAVLDDRQQGAIRLANEVLAPAAATESMHQILERLGPEASAPELRPTYRVAVRGGAGLRRRLRSGFGLATKTEEIENAPGPRIWVEFRRRSLSFSASRQAKPTFTVRPSRGRQTAYFTVSCATERLIERGARVRWSVSLAHPSRRAMASGQVSGGDLVQVEARAHARQSALGRRILRRGRSVTLGHGSFPALPGVPSEMTVDTDLPHDADLSVLRFTVPVRDDVVITIESIDVDR